MSRPAVYPHWTDQPEHAAAQVACGLLDQGLSPLILVPPERSGAMSPLFPDGHALVPEGLATRTQDKIFRAWLMGAHLVLLSELVPPACLGDGLWSSIHVLLPFLAGDSRCHALSQSAGIASAAGAAAFVPRPLRGPRNGRARPCLAEHPLAQAPVVGGKAVVEAGAVTRRRVRCSAW